MAFDDKLTKELTARIDGFFGVSYNCAQSAFVALQQQFDLKCNVADFVKALRPFPGVGLSFETCGAVSGCLLALGLVDHGPADMHETARERICMQRASDFCSAVSAELGTTRCGVLLETRLGRQFDLRDASEWNAYQAAGGKKECGDIVKATVKIAGRLMADVLPI